MKSLQHYDLPAAIRRIVNREIIRLFPRFLSTAKKRIPQTVGPFLRLATAVALVVAIAGWTARSVYAGQLDFTFHNESGKTIVGIYVSPASTAFWGENVLGWDIVLSGDSTRVNFLDQNLTSPCLWDIKAVYEDGTSAEKQSHNLCQSDNSVVAQETKRSESQSSGGETGSCESRYRFFEDRMCHCYGMC